MKKKFKVPIVIISIIAYFFGMSQLGVNSLTALAKEAKTEFTVSKVYSGFKLLNKKYVQDVDSTVYEFEHEKTGAKLVCLQNNDNNKVFGITFKTLCNDNTGVNHIIEHGVLEESNTKLGNPYTGSEFTQYYILAKKEDDFQDEMGKCLNDVFFPKLSKMVFMKHGWRYEIDSPNEEMKINGIVYNEMKGKDSPIQKLIKTMNKSLLPNTIYKFNSGGDPNDIPKLSYGKFLETYNKNYTPSNSLIYLYGNMNIEKSLENINNNLSKFNKTHFHNEINEEKPFSKMKYVEDYYPSPVGSNTKNSTYLSLNYATCKYTDYETKIGLCILGRLIMEEGSPLKKAFLDNKIEGNVFDFLNDTLQMQYGIMLMNSNESQKEKFVKVVNDSLNDIVKKGFDKQLINSVINSFEMGIRNDDISPNRGQDYMEEVRSAWLYKGDILGTINKNSQIKKIRGKAKNRYFEKLIEKYILNNNHSSLVVLKPKPGLEEENAKKLKSQLAKYKSSLSKKELNNIINKNRELKKWQEESSKSKGSKEETLTLEDISKKSEEIPTEVKNIKDTTVLKHLMYTNGLQYINLYYDTNKVPQNKLMYLMLLTNILGKVDTENYNRSKLVSDINTYTGGISISADAYKSSKNKDEYYPKLKLSFTSLNNNLDNAFVLLDDITNKSKFEDKNNLRNLIKQIRANIEFDIEGDIFKYVREQAQSYTSDFQKYNSLKCTPFYQFICELDKNFDKKSDEIIKNLNEVKSIAFNKENLIVSYTGDESKYNNFEKSISNFLDKVKHSTFPVQKYKFDYSVKREGFAIPSKVQYIAKAGDFEKLGYEDSGKLDVLKQVLSRYLTMEIRAKSGAYGAGAIKDDSSIVLYSYRDPKLKETINTFNNMGNFLKNFTADKNEMITHITRAIYVIDFPKGPMGKGTEGDEMYITGRTQQDVQKYRDEILSTTVEDIRSYAGMIDDIIKQNNLCAAGNEEKLKSEKDLFQVIKNLVID